MSSKVVEQSLTEIENSKLGKPEEAKVRHHQTSYFVTLVHLFKANIGPGEISKVIDSCGL